MKNQIKITFIFTAILICHSIVSSISAQDGSSQPLGNRTTDRSPTDKKIPAGRRSSVTDSWTGFYVGGYGGVAFGKAAARTSAVDAPLGYFALVDYPTVNQAGIQDLKGSGFNGGGTFGYNHQLGRYFIGAETDLGIRSFSRSTSFAGPYVSFPCCGFTIMQSVKSTWELTARPRFGIASKRTLIYATGGLALTDIRYSEIITDNAQSSGLTRTLETASFKKVKPGWTAGGGVEFKISKHWSAKAEYDFSDFGRITTRNSTYNLTPGQPYTHSAALRMSNVKVGVNYRF